LWGARAPDALAKRGAIDHDLVPKHRSVGLRPWKSVVTRGAAALVAGYPDVSFRSEIGSQKSIAASGRSVCRSCAAGIL
jgi:hypothetical protein